MGSPRRRNSHSPTRRRRTNCASPTEVSVVPGKKLFDSSTIYGYSTILIWLIASSTIVLIHPLKRVQFETTTDFPSTDKMYGNQQQEEAYDRFVPQYEARQQQPISPKMGFVRPMGLRWRDDSKMLNQIPNMAMPILTEHRSASPFGRSSSPSRPTTSNRFDFRSHSSMDDPSLEDLDLIDVLWRSDIAVEKGARQVAPAEQYQCDLQMLTEKSNVGPLSPSEHARYEDLSKGFYQDFYPSFNNNNDLKNSVKSATTPAQEELNIPTDQDLAELLDDVSKEEGQLNSLFDASNDQNPVINNVSMTEGIVYSQNNITEMQSMRQDLMSCATSSHSNEPAPPMFNGTDSWMQPSMMKPADIFPPSNYTYIPMHNDSLQAVFSNGNVNYDHAYSNPNAPPQLEQQQPQHSSQMSSPAHPGLSPTFDTYHATRNTFSDCTDSSSTCSRVSSESPRYHSESGSDELAHVTRFYGKLVPNESKLKLGTKIARVVPLSGQRKRGRQSKDEQLASDHSLPVSARRISEMSLSELQQLLKMESLSEYQRQLIRKIRRRGKNKVAARTCRQRRTDRHDTAVSMSAFL